MDAATTVKAYTSLSQVEEAFRCYKSIDLKVRPIYHYKGDRVNWTLDKEKQICVKLTQIKFEAISPLSQPEKKLKNSGS